MTSNPTAAVAAARERLIGRLMGHVVRDPGAVRKAMKMLGGASASDFDNRRLAALLSYLGQPIMPEDV